MPTSEGKPMHPMSKQLRHYANDLPGQGMMSGNGPMITDAADELDRLAGIESALANGWMPYRLVHERTEDEVIVMPEGWFLWRLGDPEKSTRLGDFRVPWQDAIRAAEESEGSNV